MCLQAVENGLALICQLLATKPP